MKDRKPAEVERDRILISRLYLQGKLQSEIAVEVKLAQGTVSKEIKFLIDEWQKERIYNITEAKARELSKVDNLEREYWDAWHRSLQPVVIKSKKATQEAGRTVLTKEGRPAQEGDRLSQEQSERTEPGVGDPRYLQGVQWCIERRCLILGVDAPKKIEGSGVPIGLIGVGIDPSKI